MSEQEAPHSPACPWCGASVTAEQTNCPACGAALAQRESIGGLKIPGLTSVDPALEDFDKRPIHLRGPSPTQGAAPGLIVGALAGGPLGLVAVGGVAALAAAELLGTKHDRPEATSLENLGRPSDVVLQAIEHADAKARSTKPDGSGAEPGATADDEDGMSVWRDLPPTDEGAAPETDEPDEG